MVDIKDNIKLMLLETGRMKPGQDLVILTDTHQRSTSIAHTFTEVAKSVGLQTVLIMMDPREYNGQEPPPAVAAAMQKPDVIIEFCERNPVSHTNARKDASAKGIRYFLLHGSVAEDFLAAPISLEELKKIKAQTEKLTDIMTQAKTARVTSFFGTDITMSLEGRDGVPICPLADKGLDALLDYAEVAISPVEGTTQGTVVVDAGVRGWEYILETPIRFKVKDGRVLKESVKSDNSADARRFIDILDAAENGDNCAAELGIGTAHTVPPKLRGDNMRDYAQAGNVHLAVGRNNDIGGRTWSQVHVDVLLTRANVELDGKVVVDNGNLKL